ncbi:phosphotransferase enzyme family protein [Colletotrichum phormii]|uniref:Phosphotransferase enzyme family protein n=1 Tax=Colletotrichum phormii TaxID=359342 RepID=A0AAI9ZZD1_9PEZI|nr:phosphotransferase enzyme family protein [Colletotrichum phormii]KAK1640656.1 phosphotransferase enzyme family protein [Colletotrichum phormii]
MPSHAMSTVDTSPPIISFDGLSVPGQMKIFPESSFFGQRRALTLPAPAEVRARNKESDDIRATSFDRPPPVTFSSLGLLVKYGSNVTILEAQTQKMVHEQLQGKVPVPEIFGWTEDGGQRFIYMSLIEGATLQERWCDMNEDEKRAVCEELQEMVKALRALEQDSHDRFIGSLGKQPLNEIFLASHPDLRGPFVGSNAVQQFQDACGIEIDSEAPIVLTHDDLVPPNVVLSLGLNPKVAAIIDWGQAGWLPAYWEYCKARRVRLNPKFFSDAAQEEWRTKYLPTILDPVDDEAYYHPWLYFVLSKGI